MIVDPLAEPECRCRECRRPSDRNAGVRIDHADAHAGFREWLATHRPGDPPPKPSLRTRVTLRAQENRAPWGRCSSVFCVGRPAHPRHVGVLG